MSDLSPHTVEVVKRSAQAFRVYGAEIARRSYQRLAADPSAQAVFGTMMFDDPQRSIWFAELMVEAIENIDDRDALASAAQRMGERHLDEGVTSAHYICLAQVLPAAARDILGLGLSDPVIDAWEEVFWYLAAMLTIKQDELLCAGDTRRAA